MFENLFNCAPSFCRIYIWRVCPLLITILSYTVVMCCWYVSLADYSIKTPITIHPYFKRFIYANPYIFIYFFSCHILPINRVSGGLNCCLLLCIFTGLELSFRLAALVTTCKSIVITYHRVVHPTLSWLSKIYGLNFFERGCSFLSFSMNDFASSIVSKLTL